MIRALLIAVLMLLVALPHGVCMCPHAPAAETPVPRCCGESETLPSQPCPQPDENDDHDERNCSCKLNQELAADVNAIELTSTAAALDGVQPLLLADSVALAAAVSANDSRSVVAPVALIPCALRI